MKKIIIVTGASSGMGKPAADGWEDLSQAGATGFLPGLAT